MEKIYVFLIQNPLMTLFITLGIGYLLGQIKIRSFSIGPTVGTLLAGLLVSQTGVFEFSPVLKMMFFTLFCFTIGYEAGPAFFATMRASGLRLVLSAVFFCLSVFGVGYLVCSLAGYDAGTTAGLIAGAQTQTAIIGAASLPGDMETQATVVYALTYVVGTLGAIFFVKNIAPKLLGKSLSGLVKARMDSMGQSKAKNVTPLTAVQLRAYIVEKHSDYIGMSVEKVEQLFPEKLQIENVYRNQKELALNQNPVIEEGDVLVAAAFTKDMTQFDDRGLIEVADPRYLKMNLSTVELVITDQWDKAAKIFNEKGLLPLHVIRNGHEAANIQKIKYKKGDIVKLTGLQKPMEEAVQKLGYIKDTGFATDIPFLFISIAAGLLIGMLVITIGNIPMSLGTSGGALIAGLISGWYYNRHPRFGRIPDGTRWFLKSVGLNMYIGIIALQSGNKFAEVLMNNGLMLLITGVLVTFIPHVLTLYFSQYVLKLDPVDILGGHCGSGTCTAALNALAEETGSSVFALSYAPTYAVSNVLLTIVGMLLTKLM